jgi:hypothetical protein
MARAFIKLLFMKLMLYSSHKSLFVWIAMQPRLQIRELRI